MKNNTLSALLIIGLLAFSLNTFSQSANKPTYVIVHGAWGGGWSFKKVDSLLTAAGSKVYRPTLTGQGERVHLATPEIGLSTHIQDVVNTILFEDLRNVILVGHSYGGMVVTGVADSIPERISKLIYLDAFVPEDGESVFALGRTPEGMKPLMENGFLIPRWVRPNQPAPKDVPHSVKTFTDKISLKNPKRMTIPTHYILTVDKGKDSSKDDFSVQADKARKYNWPVTILEADHNPQWSAPLALVDLFKSVISK
ncbi:MAG TPA: alpha/beta fold hydrolase [Sediminibacterium sp.]|uniref:alpha/beta fold hydrolase n=1 Tax=Sediminibacterium sp. TaxID=1917865 RepID=UPI000ADF47FA|nr:alpha/beta fold hydrolase [Sediminibacterium sp.]HLD52949.1 alpha/beta fold hydrolase [Sediminibacterium sp.]